VTANIATTRIQSRESGGTAKSSVSAGGGAELPSYRREFRQSGAL
jgi:hypothetical protein